MKKYAEIEDVKTQRVRIGIGDDTAFYESIGMTEMEVEQGYDGAWYVAGHAPEKPFSIYQEEKLHILSAKTTEAEDMAYLTSSIGGIVINAGERANTDIEGLIKLLKVSPEGTVTEFCCYDDSFYTVSLSDLETMQIEVIKNGHYIYKQKWAYRNAIKSATTKEELDAIDIKFNMSDFSI